jgi:hypothetical protein
MESRDRTKALVLPDVGLHTNSVEGVFPEESQPRLHGLRISIFDLNQSTESDSLEVLLALLVYEVTSRDGPTFDDARERNGSGDREVQIIRCADGEVGKKFHVFDAVGS